jgi:hypothetical protein
MHPLSDLRSRSQPCDDLAALEARRGLRQSRPTADPRADGPARNPDRLQLRAPTARHAIPTDCRSARRRPGSEHVGGAGLAGVVELRAVDPGRGAVLEGRTDGEDHAVA